MSEIGVHTFTIGSETFYPWVTDPLQSFAGHNNVAQTNQHLFACFNPSIPGAQASVCWVCADVATQLLLHSGGYDLHALAISDPNVGGQGQFLSDYIARYTNSVAQFYRDHDRPVNSASIGLLTGNASTFYNVGDSVILSAIQPSLFIARPSNQSSIPGETYHMGIIIKGGNSLDDILIAQNSYSTEGFFQSDAGTLGRFQVITLRSYISRDAVTRNEFIPLRSDPDYNNKFQNLLNSAALHGVPQP